MMFPHYCSECGVVNATPYQIHPECPQCRSGPLRRYGVARLRFLERTNLEWDSLVTNPVGDDTIFQCSEFTVTSGDHLCPSCGEMNLRFDVGEFISFGT